MNPKEKNYDGICLILLKVTLVGGLLLWETSGPERQAFDSQPGVSAGKHSKTPSVGRNAHQTVGLQLRSAANGVTLFERLEVWRQPRAHVPQPQTSWVAFYFAKTNQIPIALPPGAKRIQERYLIVPVGAAEAFAESYSAAATPLPVFGGDDGTLAVPTPSLLVKFQPGVDRFLANEIGRELGAQSAKALQPAGNLYLLSFSEDQLSQVAMLGAECAGRREVQRVELNLLVEIRLCSPDPFFAQQWHLHNTGQTLCGGVVGVAGADIRAPEAWTITKGNSEVYVAILDDGVEVTHPDLAANLSPANLWYDATSGGSDPSPEAGQGHGTAIAGIIAAQAENGIGVSGVAPGVRILPVRVTRNYGDTLYLEEQWAISGLQWAETHGAGVISISWTMGLYSAALQEAFDSALQNGRGGKGCVIAVSAGNDNGDVGEFPANYEPLLTVGASAPDDKRKSPNSVDGEAWGSNHGQLLDLLAPGVKMYTTDLTGRDGYTADDYNCQFNGTSAAAPVAAGVAALVLSANNSLRQQQVQDILKSTTEKVGGYPYMDVKTQGYWDPEAGYGRINAYRAVATALGEDLQPPIIQHNPVFGQGTIGPFTLHANIFDGAGLASGSAQPCLFYRIRGGPWFAIANSSVTQGTNYAFQTGTVPLGNTVEYFFAARDSSANSNAITYPIGGTFDDMSHCSAPSNVYSFLVASNAGVITVNNDGPADYSTIQAAINAAHAGDTIRIAEGNYVENLSILNQNNLKLQGGYSEDFSTQSFTAFPTVVDGNQQGTVLTAIGCVNLKVDGLELRNGRGSYLYTFDNYWGGGFVVQGGTGAELSHLRVVKCGANACVGGVFYQAGNCSLKHSSFSGNYNVPRSSNDGACGVLYFRECTAEVQYCAIVANHQVSYGVNLITAPATLFYHASGNMRNCTIADNYCTDPYSRTIVGFDWLNFPTSWADPSLENCIVRFNYNATAEYNMGASTPAMIATLCLPSQGDPGFVDYANGDFRIRPPSVAINSGTNWGQTEDLLGHTVPSGGVPDLGAYEYVVPPYEAWAGANGLSGTNASPGADPDGDGNVNAVEYALNLNPHQCEVPNGIKLGIEASAGDKYLTLSFNPNPGASDVTYVVETSADLSTWLTNAVQLSFSPTIKWRDCVRFDSASQRFMRLKIILP